MAEANINFDRANARRLVRRTKQITRRRFSPEKGPNRH